MITKRTLTFLLIPFLISCSGKNQDDTGSVLNFSMQVKKEDRKVSEKFADYWYAGKAELTSYRLVQERYGELHEGTAVNIFVTEDFLPGKQVKANRPGKENVTVMKLNQTKKFLTGIYPYSIMTSTFSPVYKKEYPLKVSTSVQDWCGQVYAQLNNRESFEIMSHSYFQNEADQEMTLDKNWLEDGIWNQIRINPDELPTGEITIVPSFEYNRLRHQEIKARPALAKLVQRDSLSVYTISYSNIERELSIYFQSVFPFEIEKWEETNGGLSSGLKTTATRISRKKLAYWKMNSNENLRMRDSLGLSR